MELIALLLKRSKLFYIALVGLSIINGLLNTALLVFINNTISGTNLPFVEDYKLVIFISLIVISFVTTKFFQSYMIRLTNEINFDFEVFILKKIQAARFVDFENLGTEKVYTAVGDVRMLVNLPVTFMAIINALIVLVCCFAYMFWISVVGGCLIFVVMAGLLTFYLIRNKSIEKDLSRMREKQNHYYRYLGDLLNGFKEIKKSTTRNFNIYHEFLFKNRMETKDIALKTGIKYMNNELTGNFSWYLVYGVIIFALPHLLYIDAAKLPAYLITILYMMGPIAVLITTIPTYTNVKIAVKRLDMFNSTLKSSLGNQISVETFISSTKHKTFDSLRFENVHFKYPKRENLESFGVGPFNLEIKEGEVIFICGGNGSGKSTFINLLTGLYTPDTGKIYLNDAEVTETDRANYNDFISAIYSTPYIFSENYDHFDINDENPVIKKYIDKLNLTDVVRFNDAGNNFDTRLSKGQQKRLAMILAVLENRPVLVLDEWAAEQDPAFREYFYKTFLDILRADGKTIVIVTHDDNYYKYADRLIKFEFGRIVSDAKQPHYNYQFKN